MRRAPYTKLLVKRASDYLHSHWVLIGSQAWEKASENFKKSYHEWLNLMNVIPKSEYQNLQKKCEALKDKIAAQDETIRHLRDLLSDKGLPYADAVEGFTRMMEKQGHQFQELMNSMGRAFKKE